MKYFILFLFIFTKIAFACDNSVIDVDSTKKILGKVLLKDNDSLSISILNDGKLINTEEVDVSSEKKNHLVFNDYNLDGYKDFSVWHMDEGMGRYKIYRIFLYSPVMKKFHELKPACGDDFVNIRVEGDNFINVFYDDNTPKACSTPLKTLK